MKLEAEGASACEELNLCDWWGMSYPVGAVKKWSGGGSSLYCQW